MKRVTSGIAHISATSAKSSRRGRRMVSRSVSISGFMGMDRISLADAYDDLPADARSRAGSLLLRHGTADRAVRRARGPDAAEDHRGHRRCAHGQQALLRLVPLAAGGKSLA